MRTATVAPPATPQTSTMDSARLMASLAAASIVMCRCRLGDALCPASSLEAKSRLGCGHGAGIRECKSRNEENGHLRPRDIKCERRE